MEPGEVVETIDRNDDSVEILAEHGAICLLSRPLVMHRLRGGWVQLLERTPQSLLEQPDEKRVWVVCYMRSAGDNPGGRALYSDITFHNRLGGPTGGHARLGEMIEQYSEGKM